jgi:hypothetical protein
VLVESTNEVVISHLADGQEDLWIPWNRNTLSTVSMSGTEVQEWVAFMVLPLAVATVGPSRWGVCLCRRNQSGSSDQWILCLTSTVEY